MVPTKGRMERDGGEDDKNHEGDYLLDDLELHQTEGPAVSFKTYAVGGYLQAVLKEGDTP